MKVQKLNVIIITHVYATGPSFRLEEYLQPHVNTLAFIGHPFPYTQDNRSFLRIYKKGKLVLEKKFPPLRGPEVLFYLKDLLLSLWWISRYTQKTDLCIAVDNLNFFSCYLAKVIGKIDKTVFYTIDYVPQRFSNKILNSIYHFLDRFAVERSNYVWNLSPIMVEEREKSGISNAFRDKQLTVPIGTSITKNTKNLNKYDENKLVFMGHLREGQGVDLLIKAMRDVVKEVPKAHLLIIGGGPLLEKYQKLVKKWKLEKSITFTGFVKNFSDVEKYLEDAAFAVAPYTDDDKTYTWYTDPGKPKDYLASGLPVVITKVPQVAYEIDKNKCGIAISYDRLELANTIIKLLHDKNNLIEYKKNALQMAKKYTWEKIYSKALARILID